MVEEACISAHLSSLAAKEYSSPPMNYYQKKVARFQPQIIVPNNSPTNSTKTGKFNGTLSINTVSPIGSNNNTKNENFDTILDVFTASPHARTPWNSPTPRSHYSTEKSQNIFSSFTHSPHQHFGIFQYQSQNENGGHTGLSRKCTPPKALNYYQNNFQFSNTNNTGRPIELKLEINQIDEIQTNSCISRKPIVYEMISG